MPPALRGDIELDYRGQFSFEGYEEGGERTSDARTFVHLMSGALEFAIIEGVALRAEMPYGIRSIRHVGARRMSWDPATETGTYIGGRPLEEDPSFSGSGPTGLWLGTALAPFAERFQRNQQVTWRIDFAYRIPLGSTFWEVDDDGKRGAANGNHAIRFGAAFSTDNESTNPYMTLRYAQELRKAIDVATSSGPTSIDVKPPAEFDARAGIELAAVTKETVRVAFDVYLGFGYRSWSDIPSGVLLPSVLEASRGIAVTTGDYLRANAGLGLDIHIDKYAGLRLGGEFGYRTPRRLEHVYDVRTTLDSFHVGASGTLEIRIR